MSELSSRLRSFADLNRRHPGGMSLQEATYYGWGPHLPNLLQDASEEIDRLEALLEVEA